MLVGKIFGKVTTKEFRFIVEGDVTKFDYVQVYHDVYEYVLCQVVELEKQESMTTAYCHIIGFKDADDGRIKKLRIPFEPGREVFLAQEDFIRDIIKLEDDARGAYLGKLDGKDIPMYPDLNRLLTKHLAILAKSGSGKSYTVGVLLEEILDKNVPLLVIDPHGEYSSMKWENSNEKEVEQMAYFGIRPQGFSVNEYGDPTLVPSARPIKLSNNLSSQELIDILPAKLSSTQLGLLHSATQYLDACDFDSVLSNLAQEESTAKWNVISLIDQLKKMDLFSQAPTPFHELISSGTCSILNLKGVDPDIQDIIVYKLTKDLFDARKKNTVPPFFLIVEEAHNYCPERSFGEKKSSSILRTIASEGRKFGLGMGVISQRPARVDKSVLSQCNTQLIMKVTNPNDVKAISNSVEGLTSSAEKEMQEINVGTTIVTGVTDVPLFVKVRPRKSLHGGHAIDILGENEVVANQGDETIFDHMRRFEDEEILPVIKPTTTPKDLVLMSDRPVKEVRAILHPTLLLTCRENGAGFRILFDRSTGLLITDKETAQGKSLPDLGKLSPQELAILRKIFLNGGSLSSKDIDGTTSTLLKGLENECLVELNGSEYVLNNQMLFENLSTVRINETIEYESISYHEKKEPVFAIETCLSQIRSYTIVEDYAECYLLTYEVNYSDEQDDIER